METIEGSEEQNSTSPTIRKTGRSFRKVIAQKRRKVTKPIVQIDRRSEKFNQFLRDKFIETAKKYIGVPYKKS